MWAAVDGGWKLKVGEMCAYAKVGGDGWRVFDESEEKLPPKKNTQHTRTTQGDG